MMSLIVCLHIWPIMSFTNFNQIGSGRHRADQSALGTINRPLRGWGHLRHRGHRDICRNKFLDGSFGKNIRLVAWDIGTFERIYFRMFRLVRTPIACFGTLGHLMMNFWMVCLSVKMGDRRWRESWDIGVCS